MTEDTPNGLPLSTGSSTTRRGTDLLKQVHDNINGSEEVLGHMVERYGYSSLEEANEKLPAK